MTLHIHYDHICNNCDALYIPYDEDVPCPNCNTVEEERIDYISEAFVSMMYHKREFGKYMPFAWFIGSLGDQILEFLFVLFDSYEKEQETTIESYASEWLSECSWREHEYIEKHVLGIALRLAGLLYHDSNNR